MSQTAGARHLWASEQVLRSVNSADGVFVSQHDKRCSSRWGLLPLPPLSAGALIKRLPFVSCRSVEGTPCTDPTLAGPQTFLSNRTSLATAKTHVHWSHAGFISCLVLLFFFTHWSPPGLLFLFFPLSVNFCFLLASSCCGLKRRLSIRCEGQRKVSWRESPSSIRLPAAQAVWGRRGFLSD